MVAPSDQIRGRCLVCFPTTPPRGRQELQMYIAECSGGNFRGAFGMTHRLSHPVDCSDPLPRKSFLRSTKRFLYVPLGQALEG